MIQDGTILGGRYEVETLLGEGGMGTVYRARHVSVGRPFAIKVLHGALVHNDRVVARFRREAELAGRLRHDHVVCVVDMGVTDDDDQYLVMDYAPGVSLAHLMDEGPMPEARALGLVRQLCDGLQCAHETGMIHRDFKPDNVIVEQLPGGSEHARIVDFGVAISHEHASDTDGERLTEKGMVVGTPMYMAPEQARGGVIDHRTDLFALGVMMFEMLCGVGPFDGTGTDIVIANVRLPTPAMGRRAPGVRVDRVLEAVVRKLLEKDPDDRPPSARAVRELIDLYVRDRAAAAHLLGVAVGHSRSATHSAAPYEGTEDDGDDLVVASSAPYKRVAIASALVAIIVVAIAWVSRTGHPPRPRAAPLAASHREASLLASAAPAPLPTPAPAQQIDQEPIVAQAPRKPVTGKPKPTPPAPASIGPQAPVPTVAEVADLYARVGRELTAATKVDPNATLDLWPRYRWIRIMEAIKTPAKRASTAALLEKLRADLRAAAP